MLKTQKLIALLLMVAFISCAACGLMDQTADANKLVVEANGMIVKDNIQSSTAGNDLLQVLGTGLGGVKDLAAYKSQNKAKLDDLAAKFSEIEKNETVIVDKFRQASQYKLTDKYKQYLDLKTQEFSKQIEATKLVNPLIQSFMATKDMKQVMTLLEEFDAKYDAINQEVKNIQEQSNQIVKDNPTLIQ